MSSYNYLLKILCLTLIVNIGQKCVAQQNGVKFIKPLNWNALLQKAKTERKSIFVDCYATWCGPCKLMDKEVYPKKFVGDFINEKFLSVRVQMDTTESDDDHTIYWRKDAKELSALFKVTAYPRYLFFSPEGNILHTYLGALKDSDFVLTAKNALDPKKQYYTLLDSFKSGRKNYDEIYHLAWLAKAINDTETFVLAAHEYITFYLANASFEVMFLKKNIEFIKDFTSDSKSYGFSFFRREGPRIDSVMQIQGYSSFLIEQIIWDEEIQPVIMNNNDERLPPQWVRIYKDIRQKYSDSIANKLVLNARLSWYEKVNDWKNLARYNIEKINKYGLDTVGWIRRMTLNNMIWNVIFKHSDNKRVIRKGIEWIKAIISVDDNPGYLDTYANLLYKYGKKRKAIAVESQAINIANEKQQLALQANNKVTSDFYREKAKSYIKVKESMVKGDSLWKDE